MKTMNKHQFPNLKYSLLPSKYFWLMLNMLNILCSKYVHCSCVNIEQEE